MSSRTSKNTQLLAAGIVAAATIGFMLYFSSSPKTAPAKSKPDADSGKEKEEKDAKQLTPSSSATSTSEKKRAPTADATPKRSNVSDQKELHSKIEELDKKGKAQFKNKKVCF